MVVVLRCVSLFNPHPAQHTTELYSCPNSVRYEYRLVPESFRDYAVIRHYETLPRDDRMPPEAMKVEKPKKVAAKKKSKSKKSKRKKRRA